MSKVHSALIKGGLVVAGGLLIMTAPAIAHFVPVRCDFMTSGGFVFENDGGGTISAPTGAARTTVQTLRSGGM